MARVFISYRRADGQYAVGWIEERLQQIDGGTAVGTAFRDSDLKYGDDFPERLAREVDECDVLIAVIGPHWHGHEAGRPARILDPADWVGREITSALADPDKLIIPVLLAGVEPLRADDLLPDHRAFADLHAVRFDGRGDLEELAEQVAAHVESVDARRARLAGLDSPITPRRWWPSSATVAAAVLAAALLAFVGWAITSRIDDDDAWAALSAVQAAFWAGSFVYGLAYCRESLSGSLHIDWRVAARTSLLAVVLIALTVTSIAPGDTHQVVFTLLQALAAVVLMSPWIFALVGPGWSRSNDMTIRGRALTVATQRHGMGVGVGVLAVALALSIAASAAVVTDAATDKFDVVSIIGFGIFMSLILVGGLEYSHSHLRHLSELIDLETTDLGSTARGHVRSALVLDRRDLVPWVAVWLFLPTLAGVIAAVVAGAVGTTP
jgi:hypothetical protein